MGIFSKKEDSTITENDVLNALRKIKDPDLNQDVVKLGFIKNLSIQDGNVAFDFVLTTPACPAKDQMRDDAQTLVSAILGVRNVQINMQAEVRQQPAYDRNSIAGVKNVVAICSGKGGVGKSTVSVNLAATMAKMGAKVGLLDADIYGPTIPIMMGKVGSSLEGHGNLLLPIEAHGLKFMSMGLMAPGDKPLIWRGPMAHKASATNIAGRGMGRTGLSVCGFASRYWRRASDPGSICFCIRRRDCLHSAGCGSHDLHENLPHVRGNESTDTRHH